MSKYQANTEVRNVSESTIMPVSTKDTLVSLLSLSDAISKHVKHKDLYSDMAARLSRVSEKKPSWSWRYIQSVASGTVTPSKRFSKAVESLAVIFDGVPIPFAKSSPVTVYAETGSIVDGSFVMAGSRRCSSPSCTVIFVPNVPWRRRCPVCSPQRYLGSMK